jgi:serine/threonine-protein kinase
VSEKPSFFAELKRRNVYKVAVAYAVVAWLLIQAASIFLPAFEAPPWVIKIFIIVSIFGFPVALILSWAFELTPEGIKLESEIEPNKSTARRTGRRIVALTIALAVVAAGLFAFRILQRQGTMTDKSAPRAVTDVPSIVEKSIAVLPFDNLSHDPENAYFAEGVQHEILTRLAQVAELKVVSRTSTQRFKTAPEDLAQIAKQLGVANVLEGSVQKMSDQVRVNVQLINAGNGAHLWANTYDRRLTDIFAVESEIARTVAETLKARLTGAAEHVLAARPTEDPEAHQLYLRGRYFWERRTEANIQKALGFFQQAIEKDPSYALAYAGVSDCYGLMPIYGSNPPKEDIGRAIAAARRALQLDDTLAEAHTSLANALVDDLQFAAAEAEFKRAIELNPSYATAHQWYGECLQTRGHFQESLEQLQKAHELDPLSLIINVIYSSALQGAGRQDEAFQQIHRTLEMDPNFGPSYQMLGEILDTKGDRTGAVAAYEKARDILKTPILEAVVAFAYVQTGRTADARAILAKVTNGGHATYVPAYPLAVIMLALADKEEALRLLEKAFDDRSIQITGNSGSLKIDQRLNALRGDPRFQKLLARFMGQSP